MADKLNDIELDDLLLFLEEGDMRNAPPKMVQYMQTLEMIWGMHKRMLDFPNQLSIIWFYREDLRGKNPGNW